MKDKNTETSKFLSYILRHEPQSIGLTLDIEGWVEISTLLDCANNSGKRLDLDMIIAAVKSSEKKRFAVSNDGKCIRAVQGHSTNTVLISRTEQTPPEFLYHGTATKHVDSILATGLKPASRQHVHLSIDEATAYLVGQRHGMPALLKVEALRMFAEGFKFFLAENGIWLIDQVPSEFLILSSFISTDSAITSIHPKPSTKIMK